MLKHLPLINDVRQNSGLIFIITRTSLLLHKQQNFSIVESQYLLWCCAILNTFCTDITFTVETHNENLA